MSHLDHEGWNSFAKVLVDSGYQGTRESLFEQYNNAVAQSDLRRIFQALKGFCANPEIKKYLNRIVNATHKRNLNAKFYASYDLNERDLDFSFSKNKRDAEARPVRVNFVRITMTKIGYNEILFSISPSVNSRYTKTITKTFNRSGKEQS